MRKYKLYKIKNGKIHIFDILTQRCADSQKYLCGQYRINADTEAAFENIYHLSTSGKMCKKCLEKYVKTNYIPVALPDELFEI
jgi:hypothetical protein